MTEELKQAASDIDWQQVVLNGGPPCFFIEGSRFCLRAERWEGHYDLHPYISLAELLNTLESETV